MVLVAYSLADFLTVWALDAVIVYSLAVVSHSLGWRVGSDADLIWVVSDSFGLWIMLIAYLVAVVSNCLSLDTI